MYARSVEDSEFTFGVSGNLWRDALVMYDRETGSLWSHVTGECIEGDMLGKHVTPLDAVLVPYSEWAEKYPDSRILPREAGSDAADAQLFAVDELPELAFDHAKILRRAKQRLRDKLDIADIVRQLMPGRFTLSELQRTHETISGTESDKRNFRKKLKTLEIVEPTGENRQGGPHRPARLYRATRNT